jgi:hypothetical protein
MTNVFTSNPIKVNVMSILKKKIINKYVFIGIVPKPVEKELKEIEKTGKVNKTNSVLKKFYGNDWYNALGLSYLLSRKGGDEFDFDEEDVSQHKKKIKEAQISEEEIEKLLLEDDEEPTPETLTIDEIFQDQDSSAPRVKIIESSNATVLKFVFDDPYLSIYPQDKISEFKKKVYCVTKIPMYRQHMWFVSKSISRPMSYVTSIGDATLPVSIQKLSDMYDDKGNLNAATKKIDNIPLDIVAYNAGERLKIESYDNFKIMEEYFTKYDMTEINVADIKEFITPDNIALASSLLKNKQQFNLIYYGFVVLYWPILTINAFRDYLKGETNIQQYYPELHPDIEKLKKRYALEKDIMDNSMDLINNSSRKKELDVVENKMMSSITSAIINVVYVSNLKEKVIFSRNLFDKFELDEYIDACRCVTNNGDKSFILDKTYKPSGCKTIKEMISTEGIIFRINPKNDNLAPITILFYRNGNYLVKSTWRDDFNYNFTSIYKEVKKLIDPLIDRINKMAHDVLHEGKKLSQITKCNSKFVEIGVNIYYKQVFTESQFAFLKFIMEEFRKAGIMDGRNIDKNFAEYYFRKGMYKFDPRRIEKISNIKNYYEHMSDGIIKQKWFTIFEKTRITKVLHRFSDIKIEIYGIREKEFNIFYNLITSMFNMYETRKKKTVEDYEFKKLKMKKVRKTLTNLKEQDPVLYDFKKMYKSNKVYSRICQKTYQPLLLNKEGYDKLPVGQKKNIVKYWNFTSETDAYYQCPNPKYPYIKFTTKNHPKDYCIPCCKKIDISTNPKDPKRIIHDICLKDHAYEKEKKTITTGSKYIMTYGKDIEVGRLSKLPENTMEGIFYETFSMEHGSDSSYFTSDGFYLYGTNQNTASLSNVGYIYSLAHTMEVDLSKLIDNLLINIKKRKNIFNILLNGKINQYIPNVEVLISHLIQVFKNPKEAEFLTEIQKSIPWNKIFIDLAFNFLDINTILFQHKRDSGDVDLRLPNGLEDVSDYITKNKKNIIILQKEKNYYPVYLINTELFFKLGIIEKKVFQSFDGIIRIIKNIVEKYIKTIQIKGKTFSKVNLTVIKEFLKDPKMSNKFAIHRLFINHSNFCYGIQILNNFTKQYIYIPIEPSYYSFNISPNLEFNPYVRSKNEHKQTFKDLMSFINEFNRWVDVQSVKMHIKKELDLYPVIKIEEWLVLQKALDFKKTDKVIGFRSSNLYYYFDDINYETAIKSRKIKSIPLLYDPDIINQAINKKQPQIPDKRCDIIDHALYKYNMYQLFLLEFLRVFSEKTNTVLRSQIKKLFLGDFTKQMNKINNKLIEIIHNTEDLLKIRIQLSDYINNHHDRKQLYLDIDNTSYDFDKVVLNRLMVLEKSVLVKELKIISNGFVKIGDVSKIKNFRFSNMYSSCHNQKNSNYCHDRKLILPKDKVDIFIDILSDDILNPIKQKWIFSDIMSDRVINFLKFIRRDHESIKITLVNLQAK